MFNILKTSSNDQELLKSHGPFRIISSDDSIYGNKYSEGVIINSPIILDGEALENEEVIYKSSDVEITEEE